MMTAGEKPSKTAPTSRARWVDIARGLGIVLVVFGHALRAVYFGDSMTPAWASVTDKVIYGFHMPMFFILSGIFTWSSLARGTKPFLKSKLLTVVYPYFLWSLIEGLLELALGDRVNTPVSVTDLMMIPIRPIEQFWFLYALFLCFLFALLCYPARLMLVVALVCSMILVAIGNLPAIFALTVMYLPFFVLGIVLSGHLMNMSEKRLFHFSTGMISLVLFVVFFMTSDSSILFKYALGITGSFGIMAAAMALPANSTANAIAMLGRASLAIYVMHTMFAAAPRVALKMANIRLSPTELLTLTTLSGLVAPLLIWFLAERAGLGVAFGIGSSNRISRLWQTPMAKA